MEKTCSGCGESKPVEDYYKHPGGKLGRLNRCKVCHRTAVRANRAKKINYYREYDRHRYYVGGHRGEPSKEAALRGKGKWARANVAKRKAQTAVGNAVRDRRLEKPNACEMCHAATAGRALQAHHRDYSKPLEVVWVCTTCHGLEHRKPGWETLLQKPTPP